MTRTEHERVDNKTTNLVDTLCWVRTEQTTEVSDIDIVFGSGKF